MKHIIITHAFEANPTIYIYSCKTFNGIQIYTFSTFEVIIILGKIELGNSQTV